MKIVINSCFGGFSLSTKGVELYYKYKDGRQAYHFDQTGSYETPKYVPQAESSSDFMSYSFDVPNPNDFDEKELWEKHYLSNRIDDDLRNDVALVKAVEELGDKASGSCAKLTIVEIPDGVDWEIDEYDGYESIHEKHRRWG